MAQILSLLATIAIVTLSVIVYGIGVGLIIYSIASAISEKLGYNLSTENF